MSANKPKRQEDNRKPGQDQDDLGKGRTPGEPAEQRYGQGFEDKNKNFEDKNKNRSGDFETR